MDRICVHPFGGAFEQRLFRYGGYRLGCQPRPTDVLHPTARSRINVGAAEDDHHAFRRPPTASQPEYDAVHDPYYAGILFFHLPNRPVPILDDIKRNRCRNAILYIWLGASVPFASESHSGPGTGRPVTTSRFI